MESKGEEAKPGGMFGELIESRAAEPESGLWFLARFGVTEVLR